MFTSEFIKMCEKAEEIQRCWTPKVFDYYCEKGCYKIESVYFVRRVLLEEEQDHLRRNYIWLPVEGQLRDEVLRIIKPPKAIDNLYMQFQENINNKNFILKGSFKSDWKILDLIFAMESICGKTWIGEKQEWIKGEE